MSNTNIKSVTVITYDEANYYTISNPSLKEIEYINKGYYHFPYYGRVPIKIVGIQNEVGSFGLNYYGQLEENKIFRWKKPNL
tara:strand:+ start:1642 stop:1887 length:246 start_codon:yes stop_codon:yes gene_type:complete